MLKNVVVDDVAELMVYDCAYLVDWVLSDERIEKDNFTEVPKARDESVGMA